MERAVLRTGKVSKSAGGADAPSETYEAETHGTDGIRDEREGDE